MLLTNFTHEFQMHLFSVLPPTFPAAFKALCQSTIGTKTDPALWECFEQLGFIGRYENLISSVLYEQIERRVIETCKGVWSVSTLHTVRDWMVETIVPWMIFPYAKSAKTSKRVVTS